MRSTGTGGPMRTGLVDLVSDVIAHCGAEGGNPARDLAGDVLVGESDVGEHLTTRGMRLELLRNAEVTARHVDLVGAQRRRHRGPDTAVHAVVLEGDDELV